jgi:uncharacterized protein with von Willebrand factor type A (vWA) domain
MAIGDGNLAPDNVPDWLVDSVRRSKGSNLDDYRMLDQFFKEEQVIRADKFDVGNYHQMRTKASELDDLANSRHVDNPSWENIVQDEFLGMYKANPEVRNEKEMRPTHKINHAALNRAMGTREWDELLTYTQLDEWAASMAAVDFGLKLQEIFDEEAELAELQKNMNEQDQQVQEALDFIEGLHGEGGAGSDEMEQALAALQEALDGYGEASGSIDNGIKKHSNKLRQAGRQAAKHARDETESSSALLDSFGTEPGALQRMDGTARMELAARIRNNRHLKELAEKVGRFVTLAMSEQAQKITHGVDEVHDIEMGNDLSRVLPSELIFLGDEDSEWLFLERFAEKKLLQYQLRGVEKVSRGAIICMIDSSGSMSGSRDTWARAVGIALLHIAYRQNRDFYGIIFSSGYDDLIEFYFPKGLAQPNDVLDFAEAGYHGGTDFEKPVSRAVEVLRQQFNDDGAQKGDLVMITDGECAVSPDWLDRYHNAKEELAFRMYSCLIGMNSATLQVMSDDIYHITDFAQGGDVRDIFGYV